MDFAKMLEKSRKRVHKVHVLYRCSVCDREQWYVAEVDERIANAERHYHDGTRCRGRFRMVKRRAILKVWCDHSHSTCTCGTLKNSKEHYNDCPAKGPYGKPRQRSAS